MLTDGERRADSVSDGGVSAKQSVLFISGNGARKGTGLSRYALLVPQATQPASGDVLRLILRN